MFAGDLHKLPRDKSTILGSAELTFLTQVRLMELMKNLDITDFFSLGDWYDGGFGEMVGTALSAVELDTRLNEMLNGNFYGVIGNHIRIKLDSNPELFLIQPHDVYRTSRKVFRDKQIINTPNKVRYGTVQISLMHYDINKTNLLQYKPFRDNDVTYHIALFHTPWIVPSSIMSKRLNVYTNYSDSNIADVLNGVDLCICGDIHYPFGQYTISGQYNNTTCICVGSLTNTDSGESSRHSSINIPIITIYDDNSVKLEYEKFDLMTNYLEFKPNRTQEKLNTTRGKLRDKDISDIEIAQFVSTLFDYKSTDMNYFSLDEFVKRKCYSYVQIQAIRSIIKDPYNIDNILSIYRDDGRIE